MSGSNHLCQVVLMRVREHSCVSGSIHVCQGVFLCAREFLCVSGSTHVCQAELKSKTENTR